MHTRARLRSCSCTMHHTRIPRSRASRHGRAILSLPWLGPVWRAEQPAGLAAAVQNRTHTPLPHLHRTIVDTSCDTHTNTHTHVKLRAARRKNARRRIIRSLAVARTLVSSPIIHTDREQGDHVSTLQRETHPAAVEKEKRALLLAEKGRAAAWGGAESQGCK